MYIGYKTLAYTCRFRTAIASCVTAFPKFQFLQAEGFMDFTSYKILVNKLILHMKNNKD